MVFDLRHDSNDHSWLWSLNPAEGAIVPRRDYIDAVRIRIGAPLIAGRSECACCGKSLEPDCLHAMCCAPGAATVGHNRARDAIFALASLADGAAVTEVSGLIASRPALRPADILTTAAIPGSLAALDIGVCSPDAEGSGDDACVAMRKGKCDKYAPFFDELAADGFTHLPIVMSCYGRHHPDGLQALRHMADVAARRHGYSSGLPFLRRTRALLGVQLWRRVASMARMCRAAPSFQEAVHLLAHSAPAVCNA